MKRISDLWKEYEFYTKGLTEFGRQLAFACVAICWIFKKDTLQLPALILLALISVVLFFITDIAQYLSGSISYSKFCIKKEKKFYKAKKKKLKNNPEFTGTLDYEDFQVNIPETLGIWTMYLFYTKNFLLLLSYILLIIYMVLNLKIM
jgi:hypothetical protein